MGDSEDEYDRKRRDKFRGERAEVSYRGAERPVRAVRDEWSERDAWSRPRTRDYGGRVRDRGYSPSFEPSAKRMRSDFYGDSYYNHYSYHQPSHRESIPTAVEGQQPPMMSFKAFLATQDDNISDSEAIEKYNDYKLEFQRQQLNEFFVAHKDDEWFRLKYHPEDSVKRKEEQMNALKKRVEVFLDLLTSGKLNDVSVDTSRNDELIKLLDTVVIKLEGGGEEEIALLENEYADMQKKRQEQQQSQRDDGGACRDGSRTSGALNTSQEDGEIDVDRGGKDDDVTVIENPKQSNGNDANDAGGGGNIDAAGSLNQQAANPSYNKLNNNENDLKATQAAGMQRLGGGGDADDDAHRTINMQDSSEKVEAEMNDDMMEDGAPAKHDELDDDEGDGEEDDDADSNKQNDDENDDGEMKQETADAEEGESFADDGKDLMKEENGSMDEGNNEMNNDAAAVGKEEKKRKRSYSGSSSNSESSSGSDSDEENSKQQQQEKEATKDDGNSAPAVTTPTDEKDNALMVEATPLQMPQQQEEKPEKPRALHKTTSIFLRNLAATITKQEVEAMCARYDDFLRVALADPQPERRWLRRGWVTFKRDANIKEICWNLNNIRLRDCELGAIVNRDLSRRIRPVNGITAHKQVVRSDIRISAKVVLHLDGRAGLWPDGDEKKPPAQTFGLVSNNPVLHNITDYLIEEASAEEEELLGLEPSSDTPDMATTVERDEALIQVLDKIILYLRVVHSVDYYNHCEYPNEDEMPNRCGILHARGTPPTAKADISQFIGAPIEVKMANFLPEKPVKDEAVKNESKLINLSLKDVDMEIDKFVQANTRELAKDKWLCPLSGKKFKGPDFVRKHIFNKHAEKIEEVKKEVEFFNNYLRDPKRPMLAEAPQPKREETPSYSHSQSYSGSYGGYGYGAPSRYNAYSQRPRGYPPRSRGSAPDYRPVVHYRDLDAPREPEEFI